MSWGKVDDKLHAHLKAQRAGEAMALWVMALSWTSAYLTNGFVPKDQPLRLLGKSGPKMAEKLVSVGLWEDALDGYRFHDYLDHNPSAEEVHQKRTATTKARQFAGKRGAEARWQNGKPDGKGHGNADGKGHGKPVATGKQSDGNADGKTMAPSRTHPKEEGGGTRAPTPARAHAPTRETPVPPPPPDEKLTEQETKVLEALAEGASIVPGRWDPGGAAWKRKALARELLARGMSLDDVFSLGDYLAQAEAVQTHEAKTFDANWFVFGSPSAPDHEFKRLDWVCREARAAAVKPAPVPAPKPAKPAKPKPPPVSEEQRKANAQLAADVAARMRGQRQASPATLAAPAPDGGEDTGLVGAVVDGAEQLADKLHEGAEALGSILESLVGGPR